MKHSSSIAWDWWLSLDSLSHLFNEYLPFPKITFNSSWWLSNIFPPFSRIVWFEFPLTKLLLAVLKQRLPELLRNTRRKSWPWQQLDRNGRWFHLIFGGLTGQPQQLGGWNHQSGHRAYMPTSLRTWYFWKRSCLTGRCCVTHDMDWWMVHHVCQCSSHHYISPLTAAALGPRQADPTPF